MRSYWDKVKRYFWFSAEELRGVFLIIFVFGFLFSMNEWFGGGFAVPAIVRSLGIGLIIAAVAVFVHETGQRLVALYFGFKTETKVWW